jgi:hypothetical protein
MKTKLTPLIILVMLFSSCSTEKTIGIKQNIHHDDFEYSVQNVSKTEMIGPLKANGIFYIVTFRVENQAKRVEHQWDNSIAYLTDENGREYENSYELQKKLRFRGINPFNLQEKYNTQAGQTDSTMLVFEVPAEVKEVYLKVRGEFLMGDLFDGSQFKNTKIKLF